MRLQIVIVLLVNIVTTVVTESEKGKIALHPGTFDLINLGSVDGKGYFYDREMRNWTDSLAFCIQSGMRLATIETASQATFLKGKFDPFTFVGLYWTGGRDAHLPRQFSWHSTGAALSDSVGLPWTFSEVPTYQTCVAYGSFRDPDFLVLPCSRDDGYTLCQT